MSRLRSNCQIGHARWSYPTSIRCFRKRWYPQIIHFNRVFHYKPSILGYPIFGNTPINQSLQAGNSWHHFPREAWNLPTLVEARTGPQNDGMVQLNSDRKILVRKFAESLKARKSHNFELHINVIFWYIQFPAILWSNQRFVTQIHMKLREIVQVMGWQSTGDQAKFCITNALLVVYL